MVCKVGQIPCWGGKEFIDPRYWDATHDKVYEVNKQMCDLEKTFSDPLDPPSEETMREMMKLLTKKKNDMKEKKTKKMTKTEAFEWLKGKKVSVANREINDKVQSKLFACGVEWKHHGIDVCYYGEYLVINPEGFLCHCDGMGKDYWNRLFHEEISAVDILSIEIVDEKKCSEEDALDLISTVGARLSEVLRRMEGHKHVVITEDDVILYDGGMSLFHSDPF